MNIRKYDKGVCLNNDGGNEADICLQVTTGYPDESPSLLVEVREKDSLMFIEDMRLDLVEFLATFMTPELYQKVVEAQK
jgi:hypothetical protein